MVITETMCSGVHGLAQLDMMHHDSWPIYTRKRYGLLLLLRCFE